MRKRFLCLSREELSSPTAPATTTNPNNTSNTSSASELSESTIEQMRNQVMQQRVKVEEESRRHQHYHSQRSTRTIDGSGPTKAQMAALNGHMNNNVNKSYTISGHARQRSQPETYNSTMPQHQQQPQQIHQQSPPSMHLQQSIYGHNQSQRSNGRPASSYYEFEVVQANKLLQQNGGGMGSPQQMHMNGSKSQHSSPRKMSAPSPPSRPQWNGSGGHMSGGGSMRGPRVNGNTGGGPYVTQVQIQQQQQQHFQHVMSSSYQGSIKGSSGGQQQSQPPHPSIHHPQMPSASKV